MTMRIRPLQLQEWQDNSLKGKGLWNKWQCLKMFFVFHPMLPLVWTAWNNNNTLFSIVLKILFLKGVLWYKIFLTWVKNVYVFNIFLYSYIKNKKKNCSQLNFLFNIWSHTTSWSVLSLFPTQPIGFLWNQK